MQSGGQGKSNTSPLPSILHLNAEKPHREGQGEGYGIGRLDDFSFDRANERSGDQAMSERNKID
jgi:hypothetical protein